MSLNQGEFKVIETKIKSTKAWNKYLPEMTRASTILPLQIRNREITA